MFHCEPNACGELQGREIVRVLELQIELLQGIIYLVGDQRFDFGVPGQFSHQEQRHVGAYGSVGLAVCVVSKSSGELCGNIGGLVAHGKLVSFEM